MKEIALREKHELSSVMGEVYNRLRTNIEFSGDNNKVICITSCAADDGKSSVSYYLARSMAKNGKKVLYIDADLRNSVMHHRMGYEKTTMGLSHFLVGKAEIQDVVPGDHQHLVIDAEALHRELDVLHGSETGLVRGSAVVDDGELEAGRG